MSYYKCSHDTQNRCCCESCKVGVVHFSDCAVHNMPAQPNGECDCNGGSRKAYLNIYVNKDEEFVCGRLWTTEKFADTEKEPEGCRKRVDCVEIEFDPSAAYLHNDEGVCDRFAH
jgi:hypothetical protein